MAASLAEAIEAAEQAIDDGGSAADWSQLAMLYGKKGSVALAVATARRAIDLDPLLPCAWRALSINLAKDPLRQSQALMARRRLAVLTGKPGDWTGLARDLARCGHYEEACEVARHAIALDEFQGEAWRMLAISSEQLGDMDESIAAWKRVALLPGSSGIDYANAAGVARDRVRREPASADAWRHLAAVYGRLRRESEAIEEAEQAFAADPASCDALIPLLDELLNRVPREASALLRRMVAANSKNSYYIHLLGVATSKAGNGEEALEQMRTALLLSPTEPQYWYALGRTIEKFGNDQHEALAVYSKALELRPTYRKARTRMEELRQSLWGVSA